jgi:hypothetical protein
MSLDHTPTGKKVPVFFLNSDKDIGVHNIKNTGRPQFNTTWLKGVSKTASATLALEESGPVSVTSAAGAVVLTLPATVVGLSYTVYVIADSANAVSLSPNASDRIEGMNLNSAHSDDKDFVLAAPKKGDYIQIIGDGVNGWFVLEGSGVWTRQA